MAKNIGGRRIGAVRGRTQFQLPDGRWAKRDRTTGAVIAIKKDGEPFKGVARERVAVMAPETIQPLASVIPFPPASSRHIAESDPLPDAA